jgi:hypothetical protein
MRSICKIDSDYKLAAASLVVKQSIENTSFDHVRRPPYSLCEKPIIVLS